jgi:hypothetical protein
MKFPSWNTFLIIEDKQPQRINSADVQIRVRRIFTESPARRSRWNKKERPQLREKSWGQMQPTETCIGSKTPETLSRGIRALIRRHDLRHHIRDSFRARFIPTSLYLVASKLVAWRRVLPPDYFRLSFNTAPHVIWNVGIGFWWMVGVLLQLAARTAARLGQFTGAPSELKAPRRSHNRTVNLD